MTREELIELGFDIGTRTIQSESGITQSQELVYAVSPDGWVFQTLVDIDDRIWTQVPPRLTIEEKYAIQQTVNAKIDEAMVVVIAAAEKLYKQTINK